MVNRYILFISALLGCMAVQAQQTLNIHTATKGVVSFAFTEKPEVTFVQPEVLKITSENLVVEFPFNEVEKITFNDEDATPVQTFAVREDSCRLSIYDLSGKLIRTVESADTTVRVDLSVLKPGVYIIKDGKRTYKVMKR